MQKSGSSFVFPALVPETLHSKQSRLQEMKADVRTLGMMVKALEWEIGLEVGHTPVAQPPSPEDEALLSSPLPQPPPGTPVCPKCDCYPPGAINLGEDGYAPCSECNPEGILLAQLAELKMLLDDIPFGLLGDHLITYRSSTEASRVAWVQRVYEIRKKLRETVR